MNQVCSRSFEFKLFVYFFQRERFFSIVPILSLKISHVVDLGITIVNSWLNLKINFCKLIKCIVFLNEMISHICASVYSHLVRFYDELGAEWLAILFIVCSYIRIFALDIILTELNYKISSMLKIKYSKQLIKSINKK